MIHFHKLNISYFFVSRQKFRTFHIYVLTELKEIYTGRDIEVKHFFRSTVTKYLYGIIIKNYLTNY